MRILHVAALPFPSEQGTQGLIAAFMRAELAAGHDSHLACYPHGRGRVPEGATLHRVAARAPRSDAYRSGPSVPKLALDVGLARLLAPLVARLEPELVIAHHVEAAACCALVLGARPWLFCAHTTLERELPTYSARFGALVARAGGALDRWLVARASATYAVSPLLAHLLGPCVDVLPLPWSVPTPISRDERLAARAAFGFTPDQRVVTYVGNLDAYQGLGPLAAALKQWCGHDSGARFLLATASAEHEATRLLGAHALTERTHLFALVDEDTRRRAHAAADRVVVPRGAPGGIPIKLLDALARGAPVIAAETAQAGHALAGTCTVVPDADVAAWTRALLGPAPDAARGPRWVADHCAPSLYLAALARIGAEIG